MPRVAINKKKYKVNDLSGWIVSQLFKRKLKRQALADALDITRQALHWKLHHNSFTYGDLLTIFEFFGSSDEEILYVMKIY